MGVMTTTTTALVVGKVVESDGLVSLGGKA